MRDIKTLMKSFEHYVLDEQFDIGSWIQQEQITADELFDTLNGVATAIDMFMLTVEKTIGGLK